MSADSVPFTDFSVHVAPANGGTHVAIFGELDLATVAPVRKALDQAIDSDGDLIVDMRACPFVDSKGIAVLAQAAIRLQEDGRKMTLRGVHERVARIFEIAGLAQSDLMTVERQSA
jgi:anti-sigma B factor antagonist